MGKKERARKTQEILEKQKYWDRLMKYYRWVFFLLFLSFSLLLLWEKAWMAGIGMLLIAWYVSPVDICRKYDARLGILKTVILFLGIAMFALFFIRIIRTGS